MVNMDRIQQGEVKRTRSRHAWWAGFCILLAVLALWLPLAAQFGGREGDVVLYLLTSKGKMDFRTQPLSATNAPALAARFETVDTFSQPGTPIAPGFEARTRFILHNEPDDLFQYGVQAERIGTPHAQVQTTAKVFLVTGILRDDNVGSVTGKKLDFLSGAYAPFIKDVVVGPDVAIDLIEFIFWTPRPDIVPFKAVQIGHPQSPAVPPGLTGPEYEGTFAKGAFFSAWDPFRRLYPGAGWPDGVDLKHIEEDPAFGNTTRLMRIRPGKRTPPFLIQGTTHVFVLSGNLQIIPAGAAAITLKEKQYAFVPQGFVVRLSNPKTYKGPGAQ